MELILFIEGKVNYKLTLDPTVWIFDDRKIDLHEDFINKSSKNDSIDDYTKNFSNYWDREIDAEAAPPTKVTEQKFKKEKVLTGSFGIPLRPFIQNAEPKDDVTKVIIETENENVEISAEQAKEAILAFSHKGKPLREDGPVHLYFGDGSNIDNPIKYIRKFILE